ncbi:hypothetical protein L195_g050438 [Trifolium pratense]|uniref:Uncharacterized protein n=1 Tax=Trifolium pratense TaxID=57577 RepID=A0A2K3JTY7_TRIPR|nr:hypothetical protein L195_g050438 [Trifolium pratense]
MGTELLLPQDCLIERFKTPPASFSRRRYPGNYYNNYNNNYYGCNYGNNYNYNYNLYGNVNSGRINRKPVIRPEQRKRVTVAERKPNTRTSFRSSSSYDDMKVTVTRGGERLVEKVMILRRGESLDSIVKSEGLKNEGNGNDEMVDSKQIRIVDLKNGCDVYAGSAFAMSPSPSALPIPSFQRKFASPVVVDDSATRDLRRLLRIA